MVRKLPERLLVKKNMLTTIAKVFKELVCTATPQTRIRQGKSNILIKAATINIKPSARLKTYQDVLVPRSKKVIGIITRSDLLEVIYEPI
jgi:hypothetical protein